jgi:hypothetical protein
MPLTNGPGSGDLKAKIIFYLSQIQCCGSTTVDVDPDPDLRIHASD